MANRADIEQLLAFAEGTLPPYQMQEIETELAVNPEAARLVARYQLIKQRVASDDSVDPSPAAVARALAVFKPVAVPKAESWLSVVERFIARRIFDSRLEPVGLRYAATDDLINLSFETDAAEIDVQAQRRPGEAIGAAPAQDRWHIMGQINPAPTAHLVRIALARSGSIAAILETSADEHGTFVFEAEPGRYDLHINLPEGVAVLPDIDVT